VQSDRGFIFSCAHMTTRKWDRHYRLTVARYDSHADWRNGDIDVAALLEVISAWRG
jgi:hypothetical protein